LRRLQKAYGRGRWRKLKGIARIKLQDGTTRSVEIQRNKARGIGRKETKINLKRNDLSMQGIQFLVDAHGEKTAVLIDLKKYKDLWEDFYDGLLVRQRVSEPRESLKSVKARLVRQGKLK
jgi:hypothetical protein